MTHGVTFLLGETRKRNKTLLDIVSRPIHESARDLVCRVQALLSQCVTVEWACSLHSVLGSVQMGIPFAHRCQPKFTISALSIVDQISGGEEGCYLLVSFEI